MEIPHIKHMIQMIYFKSTYVCEFEQEFNKSSTDNNIGTSALVSGEPEDLLKHSIVFRALYRVSLLVTFVLLFFVNPFCFRSKK